MTEAARRSASFLLAAALLFMPHVCAWPARAKEPEIKIAVTSRWLSEVVAFICGDRAVVRPLSAMDAEGGERLISRPRRGEIIIAFDAADAARRKISGKNQNLRLLFSKVQLTEEERRAAFFDPARLPFVAQEVMKTVSAADPGSYEYYQRRLAEFQSRIDSSKGVGRHILKGKGAKMLDLTGAEGVWVRSSVADVVRPPERVWRNWLDGGEAALEAALDEASQRGWLLLLDPWTPAVVRSAASAYPNSLTLPAPVGESDIFSFFHSIFTLIASRLGEK